MARYTGPVCKLCRREGVKLFLKGDKCMTKCTLDRHSSRPGHMALVVFVKSLVTQSSYVRSSVCDVPMVF